MLSEIRENCSRRLEASTAASFSGVDNGNHGVAGFQCQVDNGGFVACSSPQSYSGLGLGVHTFLVRAVDRAGNVDASPATATPTNTPINTPTNTPVPPTVTATLFLPLISRGGLDSTSAPATDSAETSGQITTLPNTIFLPLVVR